MALVQVRCDDGLSASFAALAARSGVKPAALLRRLMALAVEQTGATPAEASRDESIKRTHRVHVRFSPEEMRRMEQAARAHVSVQAWIVAIVRSVIYPDIPPLTREEQIALGASNRELWAMGRNLNQIAHVLNIARQRPGPLDPAQAPLDAIQQSLSVIDRHTERVAALIDAAQRRGWHAK